MKILLIGKNGQVGAQMERIGCLGKHKVFAFDRQTLDITNFLKVKEKVEQIKPQVIINTSSFHVVADCEKYPDKAFEVNLFAVKNLALLCNERKIRLVNYSTSWIFDGRKNSAYSEKDIPNPIQVYGLSKYAGEIASLNYNPDTLIIRTCGIFGGLKGSRSKNGNFVLNILKEAKKQKELKISSEQTTSIVNAEDLAKATLQLLEKNAPSGVYNLVNKGYCSWAEVAREIVSLRKLDLKIIPVNRKGLFKDVKIPLVTSLKNVRAKALGVTLPYWKDGLERYLKTLPL